MVPLFLTSSWNAPFSIMPLFSTESLNVPSLMMVPGARFSTGPLKVPPRMPLLLNTLPLKVPPVMAVGLPTKTLHSTAEPSPMVLKSYSPPVWLLPVRSSMSPLVGSFLMYSQPSPLQGFLPPSESFGQPFSMTRSVLVIALFSTTSLSGMVKVTVFLSTPYLSALMGWPFRLKMSVSAVMVTSFVVASLVTTTQGAQSADTPLTFSILAPEATVML